MALLLSSHSWNLDKEFRDYHSRPSPGTSFHQIYLDFLSSQTDSPAGCAEQVRGTKRSHAEAVRLPHLVQDDVTANHLEQDKAEAMSPPGPLSVLRLETSSLLNGPEAFSDRVLVTPGATWNFMFEKRQIPLERFCSINFLIHIVSLQALMANCKIEQEDDKDLYKDKILHSLKVKQVAMLEVLTNHVWINEVFDPKGPLLKI